MNIDLSKLLKSKTIRGLLIVVIAMAVQMFAIQPQEVTQTIDALGPSLNKVTQEPRGDPVKLVANIAEIFGLAYAAYGRVVARQPLTKKKEGEP